MSSKRKPDSHYYSSWGSWENFMLSYGLKPYNPDDVQQAKAIIQAFREQDELEETTCYFCEKKSESLKLCSKCRQVRYCSVECQKNDWNEHKKFCGK